MILMIVGCVVTVRNVDSCFERGEKEEGGGEIVESLLLTYCWKA